MCNTLMYRMSDGSIFEPKDIHQAFFITTGKAWYENESSYLRYLHSLLGKSILQVVNAKDDPVLKDGFFQAVKKYRVEHICELSEAMAAIRQYRENLFVKEVKNE